MVRYTSNVPTNIAGCRWQMKRYKISWRLNFKRSDRTTWWTNTLRKMEEIPRGVPPQTAIWCLSSMRKSPISHAGIAIKDIVSNADVISTTIWPAKRTNNLEAWIRRINHLWHSLEGPNSSNVLDANFGWRSLRAVCLWSVDAIKSFVMSVAVWHVRMADVPQTIPKWERIPPITAEIDLLWHLFYDKTSFWLAKVNHPKITFIFLFFSYFQKVLCWLNTPIVEQPSQQ